MSITVKNSHATAFLFFPRHYIWMKTTAWWSNIQTVFKPCTPPCKTELHGYNVMLDFGLGGKTCLLVSDWSRSQMKHSDG